MRDFLAILMIFVGLATAVSAMEFTIVRTPATTTTSEGYSMRMSGEINPGDFEKFRSFVIKNFAIYKSHRFIKLSSNGGRLVEALKMAELLRQMYPSISVDGECASSCFFLYLKGASRYASQPSKVGIHRVYFDPDYFAGLSLQEARAKQIDLTQKVNAILDTNGVSQQLKDRMNQTSSKDIYWLSANDLRSLGPHPAWYEEVLIAKCNYGDVINAQKEFAAAYKNGSLTDQAYDKLALTVWKSIACENEIITSELSQLQKSFTVEGSTRKN